MEEGITMVRISWKSVAPWFNAILIHWGLIFKTPMVVLSIIGQTVAITIKKYTADSKLVNKSSAMGIQDRGLIIRTNWRGE